LNETGFIQALAADPEDDTTRLVYADWLEERGDPRAAWVRDLAIWRWMGPLAQSPVPALMGALAEEDWWQSRDAASALQRVGPTALPALVEALSGPNDLAAAAGAALRGFRPEDLAPALPLIRELAAGGNVPALRLLACIASEARSVAPVLVGHLGHDSGTMRLLAATGPEAAPLLLAEVPRVNSCTLFGIVDSLQQYGDSVVTLLRKALADGDARRRLAAALALVPTDTHAAVPHLVEALEIESLREDVARCHVLDCIGRLGQTAAPFAPRLRRLLWEGGDRKWDLLMTLQTIGDPALTAELFSRLRSESGEERAGAIEVLARIDAPFGDALDAALGLLSDGDERVRGRALEAIAHLGPYGHEYGDIPYREFDAIEHLGPQGHADAIAALRELFRDVGHCENAIRALGALGAPGLVADLVPLCEHEDENLRRTALNTLAYADGSDTDVASALCRALDRDDGDCAVSALPERPAALALAAAEMLARLRGERPGEYHIQMVRHLGLSADEEAELLCRHLDAGGTVGEEVLYQLSNVLEGRPPVDAMPALLRLLDEGEQPDQSTAARLLAKLGGPAVPELARRLENEKTREAAAWGLGLMGAGAAAACEALLEALHSGDDTARGDVVAALGNIGAGASCAVGELRRLMRGTSARLRAEAADALGRIGAKEALPDLRTLLSDTDTRVCQNAEEAIATLTREPSGDRPDLSGLPIPF
jgi:uncharacterized protein (TIGR02996 family)